MKIIAYYRTKQTSDVGLAAQKKAVADYAKLHKGKVVAEYQEKETTNDARPQFLAAISRAKATGATLVIAKMGRLARKHSFVATLMDSNIDFAACDNPHASRRTVHILAEVAEAESRRISQQTKDALAAARARGVKLGSARKNHWKGRKRKRGFMQAAKASGEIRSKRAAEAYQFLEQPILEKLAAGWGYQPIGDWLTAQGHLTTAGVPFNATSVWRIMQRRHADKVEGHKASLGYNRPNLFIADKLAAGLSFEQIARALAKENYTFPDGTGFTASDVEALSAAPVVPPRRLRPSMTPPKPRQYNKQVQ